MNLLSGFMSVFRLFRHVGYAFSRFVIHLDKLPKRIHGLFADEGHFLCIGV